MNIPLKRTDLSDPIAVGGESDIDIHLIFTMMIYNPKLVYLIMITPILEMFNLKKNILLPSLPERSVRLVHSGSPVHLGLSMSVRVQ